MDFTTSKRRLFYEADSRQDYRKYSINASSPNKKLPQYDSPNTNKPLTFARTSDKENTTNAGRNDLSLQRSPIDPLVASRQSAFQGFTLTEVEQMRSQHRAEIETLMIEINNLRNLLYDSSQLQIHQLHRLKQGYEDNNFLQMSTFRQNQNSQFETYQFQIRKLKEQLAEKGEQHSKLQVQLQRERKSHDSQKDIIKEEVRLLLEKKNGEIINLKQQLDHRVRKLQSEKEHEIEEIKYNSNRELTNINKILENKTRQLQRLANINTQDQKQRDKILEKLQNDKQEIESKYEKRILEQYQKYQNLKTNFNKLIFETTEIEQNNWKQLQTMFNSEYNKIFDLVKFKDTEVIQLRRQLELEQNLIKTQRELADKQNQLLKQKLKEQASNFQKQIQLLKVKIAVLHQNDLQKVKQLYDLKLGNSLQSITRLEQENTKLREVLNRSNEERYQLKQRNDISTSQLNAKILKMRMGIHSLQNDFKEKIENEKSLMLMTSRSFLKEAQAKNHNNKFLEEQIRKLRQLMDLQARQNQNAQRAVEEKILAANNQLERLSSRVLIVAQEKKEIEEAMEALRKEKDREIGRLKAEIDNFTESVLNKDEELKLIEQLKIERNDQLQEIGKLKDRVHSLQSRMQEMKAEIQRAHMEASINHQQGKKQYHQIAQSHLSQFKKFYQQKMKRLEDEKNELKKIINSQYEQITELIKKYRQLEDGMKDAVQLMQKRTVLQEKVMNLGMDTNLIKNLSQLLPHSSQ